MASDSPDGQQWGWSFLLALALAAVVAAVVGTVFDGLARWAAIGVVVAAWVAYVTAVWWRSV